MKKVLVTGADGFIGSHLTESLLEKGYEVRAFTYYNSFNNWGWLDTLSKEKLNEIEIFSGDIRDPNGVREAMKGVDLPFKTIEELRDIAYSIVGEPEKVQFGDRVVGIIEARDGTIMDVVRQIKPYEFAD